MIGNGARRRGDRIKGCFAALHIAGYGPCATLANNRFMSAYEAKADPAQQQPLRSSVTQKDPKRGGTNRARGEWASAAALRLGYLPAVPTIYLGSGARRPLPGGPCSGPLAISAGSGTLQHLVFAWPRRPPGASSGSNGCAQHGAKLSVTLYVPFATHGFTAGFAAFGIEQNPFPPSR